MTMETEEPKPPPQEVPPSPPAEEEHPESPPVEEPPAEEPPRAAEPPPPAVNRSLCETVAPEGTCSNCDWEYGGIEPHPVEIMPQNVAVPVEGTVAPPAPPPKPEPDPKACPPVAYQATCPKCEWTAASGNPHPLL